MNAASNRRQQARLRRRKRRGHASPVPVAPETTQPKGAAGTRRASGARAGSRGSPVFAINDIVEDQLVLEHPQWTRPLADDLAMPDYFDSDAMGGFLLVVAHTLKQDPYGYDFVFDQAFVDDAVGKSLLELKVAIAGATT